MSACRLVSALLFHEKVEPESLRRSGFCYSRPLIGDLFVGE